VSNISELKGLVKPPFSFNGTEIVIQKIDKYPNIWLNLTINEFCFITSEGIGDVKDFIISALNEKWKRDYIPHRKWIKNGFEYDCPECSSSYPIAFTFCPHCGERLDRPGGTKE